MPTNGKEEPKTVDCGGMPTRFRLSSEVDAAATFVSMFALDFRD